MIREMATTDEQYQYAVLMWQALLGPEPTIVKPTQN
jgi:hypothetical protein